MVRPINQVMNALMDLFCRPFLGLGPLWAMVAVSLVTGVLMLVIFGLVSNQRAIRAIKDKISGNLIGVRLFQNDIRVVLGLQGRILRDTLVYMKYSVVPMLVMIVPVLLILIQLNRWFGAEPLELGRKTLVKAHLRDPAALQGPIALEAPDGVTVETPPVRIPSEGEVAWRISAQQSGRHRLVVRVDENAVEKELVAGSGWQPVSALRTGRGVLEQVLYPGEPPIPRTSPVAAVALGYDPLELALFGWNIHWLVWFFVLSIVFGFAFKGLFGVQI